MTEEELAEIEKRIREHWRGSDQVWTAVRDAATLLQVVRTQQQQLDAVRAQVRECNDDGSGVPCNVDLALAGSGVPTPPADARADADRTVLTLTFPAAHNEYGEPSVAWPYPPGAKVKVSTDFIVGDLMWTVESNEVRAGVPTPKPDADGWVQNCGETFQFRPGGDGPLLDAVCCRQRGHDGDHSLDPDDLNPLYGLGLPKETQ